MINILWSNYQKGATNSCFLQKAQTGSGANPASYSTCTENKVASHEGDHSSQSIAKVKNWKCTFTRPICLQRMHRNNVTSNFHIRTVHLDIIKVLFIHQLMHKWVVLKNNIKIYVKTAPTCFGAVTPSSGSALFAFAEVTLVKIANYCTLVYD